jgi:hypothetical protein
MPYFSVIGIILGISLASVSNGVFSFPFLWISKFWGKEMISEKYQAFMGLGLLVYNIAQLLINYVFDDFGMLIQWWICCSCFFISLIIYLVILFGITFFHRFKFINNDYESISMKQRCKTIYNFVKGMFMLIIDILIFLVVIVVVIVASGFLNIVLALMFSTQNSLTEVMYLPILSTFMIISVTLVFPEAISRFAGVLFFKNCRRELNQLNYPLVSDVINRNPNMTLATLAMKTKFQSAWEKCNTRYMNEKILVKVVADDYITSDAMNFPRIEFKTMDSEEFEHSIESVPGDDYIIVCANGAIQFRDVKSFFEQRSLDDVRMYSRKNMLLFFSAYSIYFLIPIVRNIIIGVAPINTSDTGGAVINFLNFFFGFFLLMPQIALWIKVHSILENLKDKSWNVFKKTNQIFSSKNLRNVTIEDVNQWNAELSHVFLCFLTFSVAEFIKC